MNKQEWYEDRILWRAGKHNLFEKRCVLFPELPSNQQEAINSRVVCEGKPLFAFFKNENTWTLLTTDEIATSHDDGVFRGRLDDIQDEIGLWSESKPTNADKRTANFLELKQLGFKVWAPEGHELFALWNILKMFPIAGVPA